MGNNQSIFYRGKNIDDMDADELRVALRQAMSIISVRDRSLTRMYEVIKEKPHD